MSSLLRLTITRPVTALSLALLVLVFGCVALFKMPVQLTPNVEAPHITITTVWQGAGPLEVEREIILRQEKELEGLDGLLRMESTSSEGEGLIELGFTLETKIEAALVQVSNRLQQVREHPQDALQPVLETVNSQSSGIAWFMLQASGDHKYQGDIAELGDLAEEIIEPRLERVAGVARVSVFGARVSRLEIRIDPNRLAARGITLDQLTAALERDNHDWSGGDLDRGKRRYLVRTVSAYRSASDIETTMVALRDGVPVRISDVAEVHLGFDEAREAGFFFGSPAIGIKVQRKSGVNVLDVMRDLRPVVDRLNTELLASRGLRLTQSYDETEYIDRAISLVRQNLFFGGLLATAVLILFLRSRAATFVVAATIPVSLIGACLVLWLAGGSLNVLTLAGLAFAVGMVVDNTIVVVENIVRHRQTGASRRRAAYRGTLEVWGAILASTATTIAVFLPIVFLREELGQLFRDLSLAISAAVGCSLVVAVAVVPGLAARVLEVPRDVRILGQRGRRGGMAAWLRDQATRISEGFSHLVYRLCGETHRRLALIVVVTAVAFAGSWLLAPPADYLPEGNRNFLFGVLQPPPGYNLAQVIRFQDPFLKRLSPWWQASTDRAAELPGGGVRSMFFVAGPSFGMVGVRARDPARARELLPEMRLAATEALGARALIGQRSVFEDSFARGRMVELDFAGADMDRLWATAQAALVRVEEILPESASRLVPQPGLQTKEVRLEPNRQRLAELGLGSDSVGRLMAALVDGERVGTFLFQGREIDMIVTMRPAGDPSSWQQLAEAPLATPDGHLVNLASLATLSETSSQVSIRRLDRQRTVTVQIEPPPGFSLEKAVEQLRVGVLAPLREEGLLDDQLTVSLAGSADQLVEAGRSMAWILGVAVVLVYLMMAALFESFVLPLVILWTVPLAALGGFLGLRVLGFFVPQRLDVLAMLGFVILVGTVVNNAILIVHQALQHRRRDDMSHRDAVTAAARNRIRPIFMSAATSIFGMLPLVLFPGAGAEIYRGLGSVVIGGLLVSTLLTLLVVPALLSLVLEGRQALRRRLKPRFRFLEDTSRFDISPPGREGSGTFVVADPSGSLDW